MIAQSESRLRHRRRADRAPTPREYDTDTAKYTYTGSGGVPIGNWFNRLAFAAKYAERNILFSGAIGLRVEDHLQPRPAAPGRNASPRG